MRLIRRASSRRGFTLVESVLAMTISLFLGVGVISSIIYSRQSLELEKQRLAALNFCRQALEAVESNDVVDKDHKQLVPFNAPGIEIAATVTVDFYALTSAGAVNWDAPLASAPADQPAFCRVTVNWLPSGRWGRAQMVRMDALVRAGCL